MPTASFSPPSAAQPPAAGQPATATQAAAAQASGAEILERTRQIARLRLAPLAEAIDRDGLYPREALGELAAAGAFSGHLRSHGQPGDLGLAIETIAAVAEVCGSTGFVAWCHAACGLYLEESGNPALQGQLLADHIAGRQLGGTGLSNPMKTYAGIEKQLLRAVPDGDGYRLSGSLPWVSHLSADGYCAVVAEVVEAEPDGGTQADGSTGRQVMVLLPGTAPGVELVSCPTFSGMEGTSTYAIRLKEHPVGADRVIADPALPFVQRIRNTFVLLQCGFGLGVIQGAIASMRTVEAPLGHVNRFLDDGPDQLELELAELRQRLQRLAGDLAAATQSAASPTPAEARERSIAVLETRAASSELALRAAQSALLHQGARGYLASSEAQRRVRESHFVAIVTPALKHLRKEIARLRHQSLPDSAGTPVPSFTAR